MTTFVIATRNAHKVQEIRAILGDTFGYLSLADFSDAPSIVEDADSFGGNAAKKALELAAWLAMSGAKSQVPNPKSEALAAPSYVLADDSGLEVDALDGAPGVHSARFAALDEAGNPEAGAPGAHKNSPDAANNAKLLRLLEKVPLKKRTARFRCVLALVELRWDAAPFPPRLFEGTCEGHIQFAPKGRGGFGYDPLFVPQGWDQSFAELGEAIKNRLSHRAQALGKLRDWLTGERQARPH